MTYAVRVDVHLHEKPLLLEVLEYPFSGLEAIQARVSTAFGCDHPLPINDTDLLKSMAVTHFEIVGIVRTGGPIVSSGDSPAFETLTADGVLAGSRISDQAREWLREVLPQRGDFFAFDIGTGIDRPGAGKDAGDGVAGFLRLMGGGASTEVDFSTWGKVKELFR